MTAASHLQHVPRWTVLCAVLAPLSLIGGFVLAASWQRKPFDSTVGTISALAGLAAQHRWIMTSALCVLGLCHVSTALGLRTAGTPGRIMLALGGIATLLVAVFPLPLTGSSRAHVLVASLAFVCLSAWPLFASRRDAPTSRVLSLRVSRLASLALFCLLGWFVYALRADWYVGLAERVVAVAQALWPLVVSIGERRAAGPRQTAQ